MGYFFMGLKIKKLKDIKIGDFVKYSDIDGKGKYFYIGQVCKLDDINDMFWMLTMIGEMGFYLKNKHDLEITDEIPTGWDKYIKDAEGFRLKRSLKIVKKREEEEQKNIQEVVEFKTQKQKITECILCNIKMADDKLLKLLKKENLNMDDTHLLKQIRLIRTQVKNSR